MREPLVISVPHSLGKPEAIRRLKSGLQRTRTEFSHLISVEQESWNGDELELQVRALGQSCQCKLTVFENQMRLEVLLPWLLAALTGKFAPVLRREAALMLEKK